MRYFTLSAEILTLLVTPRAADAPLMRREIRNFLRKVRKPSGVITLATASSEVAEKWKTVVKKSLGEKYPNSRYYRCNDHVTLCASPTSFLHISSHKTFVHGTILLPFTIGAYTCHQTFYTSLVFDHPVTRSIIFCTHPLLPIIDVMPARKNKTDASKLLRKEISNIAKRILSELSKSP